MYLNLESEDIKRMCGDPAVYTRGKEYMVHGRVKQWEEEPAYLKAVVQGKRDYTVHIQHNGTRIESFTCECPYFQTWGVMCKHVVAVLEKAALERETELPEEIERKKQQWAKKYFLRGMASVTMKSAQNFVKILPVLDLEKKNYGYVMSLSLKIGRERLYVVRDLSEFFAAVMEDKPIAFGKQFVFRPEVCAYAPDTAGLMEYLQLLYQVRSSQSMGRKMVIDEMQKKKIFQELARAEDIEIYHNQRLQLNSRVRRDDVPLHLQILKKDGFFVLQYGELEEASILAADGSVVLYNGDIYVPSDLQAKVLALLHKAALADGRYYMEFSDAERELLVTQIVPRIKTGFCLEMDDTIKQDLILEELIIKMYLDADGNGRIVARVLFCYGAISFNHFAGEIPKTEKVLIRDRRRENALIRLLAKQGFFVEKGMAVLEKENQLYDFLREGVGELQKKAQVFYSDSFTKMKIHAPSITSGAVRMNNDGLLEFSFDFDEFSQEELVQIFQDIRNKRKYHRLKNGTFVDLAAAGLRNAYEILQNLDVQALEVKKPVVVPAYRAFYLEKMRETGQRIQIDEKFRDLIERIIHPQQSDMAPPEPLKAVMRDYQVTGFKWFEMLAACGFGGIMADDMGLGKTLQTIAFLAAEYQKHGIPSLVVAPTSLIYNWQAEFEKFMPEMKIQVVQGQPAERRNILRDISGYQVLITSYGLIRRDLPLYLEHTFDYCIIDEAQHIKNPNTSGAKAVKSLRANGYFALTGTPIENNLTELWSIFDFVMPGYLLGRSKFRRLYEIPIVRHKDREALEGLQKQIKPFVIRRLKKNVLKELPEKIESDMVCDLNEEQKRLYLAYAAQAKADIKRLDAEKGFQKSRIEILSIITRLRQLCCHPAMFIEDYTGGSGKMEMLIELIEDALQAGRRILVFSQFTSMLRLIAEKLDQIEVEYFYLDGSVSSVKRLDMTYAFNHGMRDVFLISLKAGGTGLNLATADMVIHVDPWWNPAVENQATDRAHRIGQTKIVQVVKLVTRGTIEEKICRLQEKKQEMIQSVVEEGERMLSSMSLQEIQELFEP